ncbi:beta-L-arabinofuranosidase domain-containing protein [Natronospora cellulosivora (SeqCode)]
MSAKFSELNNVKLLESDFKESQELGLEYLLSFDIDRFLAPCFEVQGLEAPNGAKRYQGWEAKAVHNWGDERFTLAGHSLGHWLSAAAITYKATANKLLKEGLDYAVSQLHFLQKETSSGYIGGIQIETFEKLFAGEVDNWADGYWVPWYGVHKIYQGLIDAYLYGDNQVALEVVSKFADWAREGTDNLSDEEMQKMLDVEHGGMNDSFAQLYGITGNEDYLRLARRFTHDKVLSPLEREEDQLTGLHANTQVPKAVGAAEIYGQDSNYGNYKKAARFFWETVVNNRSYVIGGNSISEHFEALGAETLGVKSCESCNTHNMLKLSEHLFSWQKDSFYMDFYENALYNHILGSQDPETGNKMYFISTLPGHYRIYGTADESFWCCTGTGMENPGRYSKCIYYEDDSSLFINLFIPSELNWEEQGLKIKMETKYPYQDKVLIKVIEGSGDAKINLRVPSWINGEMTAVVNNETTYSQDQASYMTISKNWKQGDTIEVTIPMGLEKYISRDNPNKVAFRYGPLVLAAALGRDGYPESDTFISEIGLDMTTTNVPHLFYEGDNINELLELVDANSLTFKISGKYTSTGEDLTLMPFYKIHHQFYNLYWFLNEEQGSYEKKLNDITIDSVEPDGQQDELGHTLKSKNSHHGSFVENGKIYYWRDAWGSNDAYFSYNMKLDDGDNYLYVQYWGDDSSFEIEGDTYNREFDILIDGIKIAEEGLDRENPGQSYRRFYKIPEKLIEDKDLVTVKFAVKDDRTCAGGINDIRITQEKL